MLGVVLWASLAACLSRAQNFVPPSPVPPDLGFAPGGPSRGQIESINPIAGNLMLAFPVGALPPGPGGFGTGVNLMYNSAFLSSVVDNNGGLYGDKLEFIFTNDATAGWNTGTVSSGGWGYGFRYMLWQAAEPSGSWGNSMYLMTPDGANHLLLLVSALNPDGSPSSSTFHTGYPDQPVYDINFAGVCLASGCQFDGTLVFASADSTSIRVEANTVTHAWAAYFPDGTRVSGDFPDLAAGDAGQIMAGESNTIHDRNGNTISLTNFCLEGSDCTTMITDQYNREVHIVYGSYQAPTYTTWTDTISSPGVNGRPSTVVNWERYSFTGPTYDCVYTGPSTFTTCALTGPSGTIASPFVVTSIQFPSGTNTGATNGPSSVYLFDYEPSAGSLNWGQLHTMTRNSLTSGSDITPCIQGTAACTKQFETDYAYYFDSPGHRRWMGTLVNPISSKVLKYQEQRDGASAAPQSETTTYAIPVPTSFDPSNPPPVGGTSTITGPDGSPTVISTARPTQCTNAKSGLCPAMVYKVVNPDGTKTETGWASNTAPSGTPAGTFVNPYPQYTVQTIGAEAKGVSIAKDANNNTTAVSEYDWFAASALQSWRDQNSIITGIPGSPARTVSSTFYPTGSSPVYWDHTAPAYLRAVHTATIGNSSTTYSYDSALTTANLIGESRWDSASSQNIGSSWTYVLPDGSVNGNVVTATDANNFVTKIVYDSLKLYPIEVDVAYQTSEQRTTSPISYDFNSGLLTSSTDSDNSLTAAYLYDNLGRQTRVTQTGTGEPVRTTSTYYDDVALSVQTTQDQTSLTSTTYFDPLGRVRLTVDAAGNKVQKAFRTGTSGVSYELASNPYTTIDQTMGWTLIKRDAIAAVTTAKTYSGASPPAPWASNSALTGTTTSTAYDESVAGCSGVPATDVQDQANNVTSYCQDGLGSLTAVRDAAGHLTQHTYDILGDLTSVTQAGQTRAYEYSSLGRMTKACNPENGTASCTSSPLPASGLESYTYDANGNLLTRTDARSVTTHYNAYDGLNRPHTITYSDGTPTVTYGYNLHNINTDWIGALASVTTSNGSSTYTHDGFGRIATSTQTTGTAPAYGFIYTYSLADQLTQLQYPSGRVVKYVPDGMGGISGVQNVATGTYYAQSIAYTAAGGISSLTLGNNVVETSSWNDRLQLIGRTMAKGTTNLLALGFFPCSGQAVTSCSTGNVGNVQSQSITFPALSLPAQNYTYDALNRIGSAGEGSGWSRAYGYAEPGNQYVNPTGTSGYTISSFTPTAASNFDARNRLNVNSAVYDPLGNGNQTGIGAYAFTWDAEGRLTNANLGSGGTAVSSTGYVYDGDGQRVQKITCPAGTSACTAAVSGATATTYVYDAWGNLAAEYGGSTTSACGTPTCYLSVDQLGSTRLVTDSNGNAVRRYDYLPSGEELWAGTGGRTTAMGYQSQPDGFNPKFTGQVRDTETDLDFFNARYYSSQQARFVSPDPENAGASMGDPQTWNGYSYVGNNPMSVTDPSGLGFWSDLVGLFTNIFGLGWGNGGMNSVNDGPWNEQVPSAGVPGSGGTVNTGGVYGGGQSGPFVFNMGDTIGDSSTMDPSAIMGPDWLWSAAEEALDLGTKFKVNVTAKKPMVPTMPSLTQCGDYLCDASGTIVRPNPIGLEHDINADLAIAGIARGAMLAADALSDVVAKEAPQALFGRGGGLLNSNDYLRVGYGWEGSATNGSNVFRIALGSKRLPFHWHFTLWRY